MFAYVGLPQNLKDLKDGPKEFQSHLPRRARPTACTGILKSLSGERADIPGVDDNEN